MLSILPEHLGDLVNILFETVVIVAVVIGLTRLNGLRSFSKQSAFDFPITVATGSVIATTIAGQQTPVAVGIVAAAALFALQALIALLRVHLKVFERAVDNRPLLLMEGERIDEANLRAARMSRDDLLAKLRTAGISDPGQVRAVVFETTADVSVIKGPPGEPIHPMLMEGVRRSA
jgi:uncharacterized membrane protein YcaP (DUF421 family)